MSWEIKVGEVLAVLAQYPDNHFDGLLCDPPYGFKFMGKKWDYDVPSVDIWRECFRVLKPGALKAGWGEVLGIEREEDYAAIARARIEHWMGEK